MGDLIGYVPPPNMFTLSADSSRPNPKGMHGYLPSQKEMEGVLFVRGDGVAHAELPVIENIRVAATIATYLGIEPPKDSKAKAISSIFPVKMNK